MSRTFDRRRSLDELDPPAWGEPGNDSYLVTTCHRLRRKPLGDYSIEDLRIMIGQTIGLAWLVPIAVEALEVDPLAEGDMYPGDLLAAILRIESRFWSLHPEWLSCTKRVLDRVIEVPKELKEAVAAFNGSAA